MLISTQRKVNCRTSENTCWLEDHPQQPLESQGNTTVSLRTFPYMDKNYDKQQHMTKPAHQLVQQQETFTISWYINQNTYTNSGCVSLQTHTNKNRNEGLTDCADSAKLLQKTLISFTCTYNIHTNLLHSVFINYHSFTFLKISAIIIQGFVRSKWITQTGQSRMPFH
jgi:hypothetical protein